MAVIHKLDKSTIDLIAAGEVIERVSSVVKELVENAIDAGAKAVTVELQDGGLSLIRVTDDGMGMDEEDVRTAFESHATSKIRAIDDLMRIRSLGFRGEALSSIAAVSKVELTTRTRDAICGTHYVIHGGEEQKLEEVGAPEGTTIVVRDLFYNTPARKKFLRLPRTEGGYAGDLMERMALAFPDIAFHLIRDRKDRLVTTGSGDYRDLIRRIFGRETAASVHPVFREQDGYSLAGYLGEPSLNRANRNHEFFFVNGRIIKDRLLSRALEEGYREYLMQHRFPFAILLLQVPPEMVDVNAHPSKTEVRFHDEPVLRELVVQTVHEALHAREMIPSEKTQGEDKTEALSAGSVPEPFEKERRTTGTVDPGDLSHRREVPPDPETSPVFKHIFPDGEMVLPGPPETEPAKLSPIIKRDAQVFVERDVQMNLFDLRMLTREHRDEYRILGQVFDTYWVLAFRDKMYLIDQHAAHEKVNYERMMARYRAREMMSQLLQPPLILTLTQQEEVLFQRYEASFKELGFQIEPFGANTYAMRAVPVELYGAGEKELFLSVLDDLGSETGASQRDPELLTGRIATMACKASVKGNTAMTTEEMEALIDELLTLENPYNCPHGRPTIISFSKYEIERRFKRIV